MCPLSLNSLAFDSARLWSLCSTEDGSLQHATIDADSVLDVLRLRLRKLRASTGEDVLTVDCMLELARRLEGRAKYGEAEKIYRECLQISADLSLSQGPMVIALVLRLVFFRFLMKGIGAALLLRCFRHNATKVASKLRSLGS